MASRRGLDASNRSTSFMVRAMAGILAPAPGRARRPGPSLGARTAGRLRRTARPPAPPGPRPAGAGGLRGAGACVPGTAQLVKVMYFQDPWVVELTESPEEPLM
ncbi:hypothetical protein GCM10027072_32860 [Streptomyces bullii]